jgi:hypothetical protein
VWANGVDGTSFSSNGGGSSNQGGLALWWGLSFRCLADNTERHLFDCRTGDTKFKGALNNTGDAFFSSSVSVRLGITANSLTVNDMFVNNTISALAGISSSGDILSSFAGGNNIGTSGSPWGGVNTLTASLGDATTTSLSNSGVISINSGDGEKIVLTSVGTSASKITHSAGWGVNYHARYNNSTCGVHNFYIANSGKWSNNIQFSSQFVNINGTLSNTGNVNVGGLLKVSGDTSVSGIFTVSNEIRASTNSTCQLRWTNPLLGGSSWMYRWDSSQLYLLFTDFSNANGSWNTIRPTWYNTSGDVFHANGQVSIAHSTGAISTPQLNSTTLSNSGSLQVNGITKLTGQVGIGALPTSNTFEINTVLPTQTFIWGASNYANLDFNYSSFVTIVFG